MDETIQILVAAMNQDNHCLIEKMNIQSNVIVGNQCDHNSIERFDFKGREAIYLNFCERGVGLNRNNTLMRATADICLFADDDMIYIDGYEEVVRKAFGENRKADIIIFEINSNLSSRKIKKTKRVYYHNYMRYGTARIGVKLKSLQKNTIYFNQLFGGGAQHSHGEDSLFLSSCLKHRLRIYAVPILIANLTYDRESTWFNGYDEKYIKDQGCLYKAMSKRFWKLLCLQDAVRRSKSYNMTWIKAYRKMIDEARKW